MVGGDVDALAGRFLVAERRHPVESLNGEGVCGVRQQVPHLHPPNQQVFLRRAVADAVFAGLAGRLGGPAYGAPD